MHATQRHHNISGKKEKDTMTLPHLDTRQAFTLRVKVAIEIITGLTET